jgi:carbonic anhydrase
MAGEAAPPDPSSSAAADTTGAAPPPARRLKTPLLAAGVAVPLLAASFVGALFLARAQAQPAVAEHAVHWAYEGAAGPSHWGELDPHAAACQEGKQQSPVDVVSSRLMPVAWLTRPEFRYKASQVQLVNNGHTFQVNFPPGSTMTLLNRKYELRQLHYHTPSEHQLDGQAADLEVHLVHAMAEAPERLAVVAVLIREGEENPFMAAFWGQLPAEEGPPAPAEAMLNAGQALPRDPRYFTYDGSLTTPPCSEVVKWVVLREPVTASAAQIERFRAVFTMNARPAQPLNGRYILTDREAPAGR